MTLVNLDDELYVKVKEISNWNKVEYPTIRFFINNAVKEAIEKREKNAKAKPK